MSQSPAPAPRLASLDFVRGVAILLVMGWHFPRIKTGFVLWDVLSFPGSTFGWVGVSLFFVLSGFLVGGLILREVKATQAFDAKKFIFRRGFKIWPAYYVFVFYSLINSLIRKSSPSDFIWQNVLHIQNYAGTRLAHTWSLAVEEHFYLALALWLWMLHRQGKLTLQRIFTVCLGSQVLCLVLRIWQVATSAADYRVFWYTHNRLDGLAFGVALAALYHYQKERFDALASKRILLSVLTIGAFIWLALVPEYSPAMLTIGLTLVSIGSGALLLLVFTSQPGVGFWGTFSRMGIYRIIAWIGTYSYGIYLWHGTRFSGATLRHLNLEGSLPQPIYWLFAQSLYYGESILTGYLLTRLVEWPMLKVRDRLFPPTTKGGALAVDTASA